MQIADPGQIAPIIRSDTLEGVTLRLCYLVLDLQNNFNTNKSDEEQVNFITNIEINDAAVDPYVTIALADIGVDFKLGTWVVKEDPLGGDVKSDKYPWNSESVLQCLCHTLMTVFDFEKSTVYNPSSLETMRLSLAQNTNINEAMFTLNATYEMPLKRNISDEGNIIHNVDPYLIGSY